uniref:Reverse transcriptase zinc-binding domain-containing protein n=1 Tax=Cannabis sativa TaxID=3483 RepID=A0A803NRD3_CANSA
MDFAFLSLKLEENLSTKEEVQQVYVATVAKKGKFIASRLYIGTLQHDSDSFYKTVWCNLSLPEHRFILWQVVHGHLLTRDNFSKCHVEIDSKCCPMCSNEEESHHYLFFNCCVSMAVVVQQVFDWCGCVDGLQITTGGCAG